MKKIITIVFLINLFFMNSLYSQEINLRTIPIIARNQADIFPSLSRGMGNLSIVFDDTLSDLITNPAKHQNLKKTKLFFSPTKSSWSDEDIWGSSTLNSFPFGLFLKKENFFAGGIISYQSFSSDQITSSNLLRNSWNKKDRGNNIYFLGLLGIHFPDSKLSIGGSVYWNELDAIDGVNLLYPDSYNIKQKGKSLSFKLGFVKELHEQDQLEFVFARTAFKSSHEVTYISSPWMPFDNWVTQYRVEVNKDESKGWVIHTKYNRSINKEIKIGAIFTINWKEHPKIPNYQLANIPRDPGSSAAYNIGVGFTKSNERVKFGFEYIYEPMTSYTWAESDNSFAFPPGFKTVENFFDFYNHIIRAGLYSHTDINWLDYRLGLQLHFNKYNLNQNNNIANSRRSADENWLEKTFSGGFTINISNFQILYSLQVILGNGIVGAEGGASFLSDVSSRESFNDFLIAPYGSLVVEEIPLITQQLSFVYNL